MCLYEKEIQNRRYIKNKTNKGVIPPLPDNRLNYVTIGCGNCIECRKEKAREWQVRLLEDIKTNTNGKMITLTFSNESIAELTELYIERKNKKTGEKETIQIKKLYGYEKDNAIATKAVRLFNERYRKQYKKAIRHWLVTELGHKGTENIHMHGIIWTDIPLTEIEQIWKYGFIWKGYKRLGKIINYVNAKTVNYTIKYISKIDQRNKEYKSKILTSPGIGANYINTMNSKLNKYNNTETNETYKTSTGHKIKLPVYWRNKIYTEQEKEQLWINKLDQQIKWIQGIKIDISKGFKNYNNVRQHHRERNTLLGYGGKPNDNRKEHEEQRREKLIQKRIQNASPARQNNIGIGLYKGRLRR